MTVRPTIAVLSWKVLLMKPKPDTDGVSQTVLEEFGPSFMDKAHAAGHHHASELGVPFVPHVRCADCDGIADEYMVHDAVWDHAWPHGRRGFLCLSCLEKRLNRYLTLEDFTDAPINKPIRWGYSVGWTARGAL